MKDNETTPLSDEKKELKRKENYNIYKIFFFISTTLHILSILIIIVLIVKLSKQKKLYEQKLFDIINEKETDKNINYYNITDIISSYNDSYKYNNNFQVNKENLDEKPIIDIDKTELLEMCYKSREYYFNEGRKKQNGYFPVIKYISPKTETIQSKLNYLIVHESPDYKSKIVDKIKLHEYAYKILGKDICVPIIKIYQNASDINFNELPDKFVLKCNHGAGMNIIVNDKSKINYEETKNILDNWMKRNFGLEGAEFQYINIKRKIFAEKFLKDNIEDYKIYCFHGSPKLIRVQKVNNITKKKINNYFTLDWKLTDIETGRPGFYRDPREEFKKPPNLDLIFFLLIAFKNFKTYRINTFLCKTIIFRICFCQN